MSLFLGQLCRLPRAGSGMVVGGGGGQGAEELVRSNSMVAFSPCLLKAEICG